MHYKIATKQANTRVQTFDIPVRTFLRCITHMSLYRRENRDLFFLSK